MHEIIAFWCILGATILSGVLIFCWALEEEPPPWRWGDAPRGRRDYQEYSHIVGLALFVTMVVLAAEFA